MTDGSNAPFASIALLWGELTRKLKQRNIMGISDEATETMKMQRAYGQLAQYPEMQDKAIIEHYAIHASVAVQAHRMLGLLEEGYLNPSDTQAAKDMVKIEADRLRTAHADSLGIKLEWPRI